MGRQNYQVLARKWRPQQFEEVVGQQAVVRTLGNALSQGRIAHAYCFSGIRGVGKTTVARLLARGLNCRAVDTATATPCGECESCVEIASSSALDVFERDAASDRGLDEMKELIDIARYAPSRDRYKVMILDEAHMLTPHASNALLKVLEEPPEYIVFVLATTEPNKILPTILSRCQHYQFARISQREIGGHLGRIAEAEGIDISADGLALIASAADGSLRDAQSLLDKLIAFAGDHLDESTVVDLLGLVDRMLLFRATDLVAAGEIAGVLGLVNEMVEQGVDLHQFTIDLLGHIRNLLVVHSVQDPGEILHLPSTDVDRLRQQAELFEVDDLDRAFSLLAANEYRIKVAEHPRYHVEVVLSRLARMPRLEPIQKLIDALGSPSGGGTTGGRGSRGSGDDTHSAARRNLGRSQGATPAGSGAATGAVPENVPASHAAPGLDTAPVSDEPPLPPEPDAPPSRESTLETVAPKPAATTATMATMHVDDPADLLGSIRQALEESHPLVAQVLGRASAVDLEDKTLTLRFPSSASIFAQRVRDPQILPALATACSAAAGRQVNPRVELDDDAQRASSPAASAPSSSPGTPATPAAPSDTSASGGQRTENGAAAPIDDASRASTALLERAESEPLVQDLLRELKGQVISVEES